MYREFEKDGVQACFNYEIEEHGEPSCLYYDRDGLQYDCGDLSSVTVKILDIDLNGADEVPDALYEMLQESIESEYGVDVELEE